MPRSLLYLLRRPPADRLRAVLAAHLEAGLDVRVLLLQDAVQGGPLPPGARVGHLREDAERRGASAPGEPLDHAGALSWIHEVDSALVW
jgi:hypothetical protein